MGCFFNMIPKILHQTWKTGNIPARYTPYLDKLRLIYPSWEYCLWTDEDNLALVKNHYPQILQVYENLPKNIMKVDLARYLILDHVGGVYLDLDYEMLRKFDFEEFDLVLPYSRQKKAGDDYDGLGNSILASIPHHPFWKFLIDELTGIEDSSKYFQQLYHEDFIRSNTTLEEAVTGPGLITRCIKKFSGFGSKDVFPERQFFHPNATAEVQSTYQTLSDNTPYGLHHCLGTWRSFATLRRLIKGLKAFR